MTVAAAAADSRRPATRRASSTHSWQGAPPPKATAQRFTQEQGYIPAPRRSKRVHARCVSAHPQTRLWPGRPLDRHPPRRRASAAALWRRRRRGEVRHLVQQQRPRVRGRRQRHLLDRSGGDGSAQRGEREGWEAGGGRWSDGVAEGWAEGWDPHRRHERGGRSVRPHRAAVGPPLRRSRPTQSTAVPLWREHSPRWELGNAPAVAIGSPATQ